MDNAIVFKILFSFNFIEDKLSLYQLRSINVNVFIIVTNNNVMGLILFFTITPFKRLQIIEYDFKKNI